MTKASSPYLNRPLRTEKQAQEDIAAQRAVVELVKWRLARTETKEKAA